MKNKMMARIVVIFALVGMLLAGFAPLALASQPASAVAPAAAVSVQIPAAKSVCTESYTGRFAADSDLLPVNRWADATSDMHSRMDNAFLGDSAQLIQRHAVISNGMATGNFMWSLGTGLSSFAINFCILDSMGGAADGIGATIGKVMLDSPLLIFLVIISVVVLLFQARRRGNLPWKDILLKGVVVALFAAMVAGATASTGGGKGNGNNQYDETNGAAYVPGVMSPGWIVSTINKTVSSLASAPASALVLAQSDGLGMNSSQPLSCQNYVYSLKAGYQDKYGKGVDKMSSGIPLILSTLWEDTGLQTWRLAQFGATGIDENSWCHLLEWNAASRTTGPNDDNDKASSDTVRGTMVRILGNTAMDINYDSKAFTPTDNVTADRSLIGWAACQLDKDGNPAKKASWTVSKTFTEGDADNKIKPENCVQWFTKSADGLGNFDFPDDKEEVVDRTESLDLRDFILTLHGDNNTNGVTAVFAYNLSALAMLAVFGLISLAIIVAKISMIVMIITAFFLVLMTLLPNANFGKLAGFLKTLLGVTIFIFGIQLLFAFISIITKMLQELGNNFLGGAGSLVAIMWSGFSPLLAVFLLHIMFTKVLKVPSPFKLSSGLAWGGAAGAAGGAAFAGVSNLLDRSQSRSSGRMKSAAKGAGRKGINSAMSAVSGGRLGKGKMAMRKGAANPGEGQRGALQDGALPGGKQGAASAAAAAGTGKRRGSTGAGITAAASGIGATLGAGATAAAMKAGKGGTAHGEGKDAGHEGGGEGAGVHHSALTNLNVPNSKLASGKMSAEERKIARTTGLEELAAATNWEKQQKAEMGMPDPDTMTGKALKTVKDSWSGARQQFREKPVRTSAKYAAGASALLLTASGAGVPIAAAAAYAAKKGGGAAYRNTLGKRQINDQRVENYRQAMRASDAQDKKAAEAKAKEEEEKVVQADAPNTKPVTPGQGSARRGSGEAAAQQAGGIDPATTTMPATEAPAAKPAPAPARQEPVTAPAQKPVPMQVPVAQQRASETVPMAEALAARSQAETVSVAASTSQSVRPAKMTGGQPANGASRFRTAAPQRISSTEFRQGPKGRR